MAACFTRLRIAGFKSFAEPVELEILPGLTGIVGPNGCGKSNVAEALRWVMGESSARAMRGGEMDDVIFTGTAARASRNLAEATITLTATDPFPPPFQDATELQVSRRIERGAGSTYRINGREARARDVQVLFADLASGARSSAMISQGRVGALVAARPDERRAVLDEAAGIGGLHSRRAEAESKLGAAEANLNRAQERLDALHQQRATLDRQAQQAARYRILTTQITEEEAALSHLRHARADAQHAQAMRALAAARSAAKQAGVAAHSAAATAAGAGDALPPLRTREAEARDGAVQARLTAEASAADRARHTQAMASAGAARARCADDLAHARRTLAEAQTAEQRLVTEAARMAADDAAHPPAQASATEAASRARAVLVVAEALTAEATAAAAQAGAARVLTRAALDQAGQRHARATAQSARLGTERARIQPVEPGTLLEAAAARDSACLAQAAAAAALDRAEAARAAAAPDPARTAEAAAAAAYARAGAEAGALTEVLATAGTSTTPLLDELHVPPGLEAALGAAFGDTLEAGSGAGLRHWRTLPSGTATGLSRHVQAPPALARALSAIDLVDSAADGAAAQAGLAPGQCLVSRDGGAWRWDGYVVEPGAPTAAATRLRQRNRLAALRLDVTTTRAALQQAQAARTTAEAMARAAQDGERQARDACRAADTHAQAGRASHASLRERASAAMVRLAALDADAEALAPELAEAALALQAARHALASLPDDAALQREAVDARAGLATARAGAVSTAARQDRLDREHAARAARLVVLARERDDWRLRDRDAAGREIDLAARLAEAGTLCAALAAAVLVPPDGPARREAEAGQAAATAATAAAERAYDMALAQARAAERDVSSAREALARAEQDATHAEATWRDARLDPAYCPGPVPADLSPGAEERARQRLESLTRERTQIGPVNLLAESEAEAVAAAAALIEQDREELAMAIAKLRGSVGHLNREGRARLVAVFEKIDRHFQSLFTRMFGGGRAHLALVGSDDPLLAGLDIYVQPPGKKLSALSLLSGGEQALTALSLIFAVFRCNPAPVCVLDEVDAPLDDANVERFCTLLDDMVQDAGTRFLVVTHHQLTMARMDRLYGVTMQERGVSRLLSVSLDHAVALAEVVQ